LNGHEGRTMMMMMMWYRRYR